MDKAKDGVHVKEGEEPGNTDLQGQGISTANTGTTTEVTNGEPTAGQQAVTEDLSKKVFHNYWKICSKNSIPTIYTGNSDEIAEITGLGSCKVFVFKKSFSGLSEFINQIPQDLMAWEE